MPNADKSLKKSPSNLTKTNNQSSGKNLYSMDLGTMGIPREVAHMRNSNNPLFNSDNVAGPGDYNVKTDLIKNRGPVVGFGKLPAKSMKNTQNQWEEKMEQFVDMKSNQRNEDKAASSQYSPLVSFEAQMRNK